MPVLPTVLFNERGSGLLTSTQHIGVFASCCTALQDVLAM